VTENIMYIGEGDCRHLQTVIVSAQCHCVFLACKLTSVNSNGKFK